MVLQNNELVTGECRLSYVTLLEPKAAKGSTKLQFSVQLLIPKGDQETKDKLRKAMEVARQKGMTEGKKPPFKNMTPEQVAGMKLRIEDGDDPKYSDPNSPKYRPECAGHLILNAKSQADKPPGILNEKDVRIVKGGANETELYSGMYAQAHLQIFAYDNMTQGLSASIVNLKKTRDGDPLGGGKRASAEEVFGGGSPFEGGGAANDDLI